MKHTADGKVERYEVRSVVKGSTQTHGLGFQEMLLMLIKVLYGLRLLCDG